MHSKTNKQALAEEHTKRESGESVRGTKPVDKHCAAIERLDHATAGEARHNGLIKPHFSRYYGLQADKGDTKMKMQIKTHKENTKAKENANDAADTQSRHLLTRGNETPAGDRQGRYRCHRVAFAHGTGRQKLHSPGRRTPSTRARTHASPKALFMFLLNHTFKVWQTPTMAYAQQ